MADLRGDPGHDHGDDLGEGPVHGHAHGPVGSLGRAVERRLRWVGLGIVLLGVVGVAVLWPRGETPDLGTIPFRYVDATVADVLATTCQGVEAEGTVDCDDVQVRLTSGPDEGSVATFYVLATDLAVPDLAEGDRIVLRDAYDAPPDFRYGYHDHQRATTLWWLAVVFVVVVVAFGRWQGVRALVGLAIGIAVLVVFLVPALVRDGPPLLVALAGGLVIVGVALYLAHGFNAATTVALLGSLAALVLVALLAGAVLAAAHVTGLGDDEAQVLSVTAEAVDLRGLLVAGIVIGVLGSLDDVTVTQVSTVAALRRSAPHLGPWELYREAIRVGRDHVASSVNTLVLAYAGASLPLLLFFAQEAQPVGRIVTGELVAVEVVRMLVGSIGLVAAVPVTTALAALVIGTAPASGADPEDDPDDVASGPRWDDFAPRP